MERKRFCYYLSNFMILFSNAARLLKVTVHSPPVAPQSGSAGQASSAFPVPVSGIRSSKRAEFF